ncbi:hypothetical protein DITRI_Ditri05aG0022400 [Diplodiscus trichospermus]
MESTNSSPVKKQNQTLPPRRGQVKIRIIKSLVKSVASMASMAKERSGKRKESGPDLSSSSTTAAPTPTGYSSELQMDHH